MVFQDISIAENLKNQDNTLDGLARSLKLENAKNMHNSSLNSNFNEMGPFNSLNSNLDIPEVGKEKVKALKEAVEEIGELITGREKLSKEIFREGEKIKMEITNFLNENKVKDPNDPVETQERSALRQKKIDVAELQLNEKVSCWKDVALLKKELRERQQELTEKQARLNMLEGIFDNTNLSGGNL